MSRADPVGGRNWGDIRGRGAIESRGGRLVREEKLVCLRSRIDRIDGELAGLLRERVETARRIGEAKEGERIYDPAREEEVLRRVLERCPDVPGNPLLAVYREILSLCRGVQRKPRAACLGPEGSFSEEAAREVLGTEAELLFGGSFAEVFRSLGDGAADLAVVPIENSVEGAVLATLDAFASAPRDLAVLSEISLPIRYVLASRAEDSSGIREARSHPQGLAQCRGWLGARLPGVPLRISESTSAAAREAAEDPTLGAVCSPAAAARNGLKILAPDIQDRPDNRTRFWVVGRGEPRRGEPSRTSLLFNVPHRPGALFYALEPLYGARLNLTHIQSRPLPGNPFEYLFFVDLEGFVGDEPLAGAVREMEERCSFLRILGSYPCRA
jgi:chorismate mutase/prephenate dehydratase